MFIDRKCILEISDFSSIMQKVASVNGSDVEVTLECMVVQSLAQLFARSVGTVSRWSTGRVECVVDGKLEMVDGAFDVIELLGDCRDV